MTGNEIQQIRRTLDVKQGPFAQLIGVHPVSVYRWEAARDQEVRVEPLQLQLLTVAREYVGDQRVAADVRRGLLYGGGLAGIYRLLRAVYAPARQKRPPRPRSRSPRRKEKKP